MRPHALVSLLLATLATACGSDDPAPRSEPSDPPPAHATTPPVADTGPISGVHDVRCGCSIEGIGRCGNYIDIAGHPLPLQGDLGLGKMEFCGQEGLRASVEGQVLDGAFVATAFERVD